MFEINLVPEIKEQAIKAIKLRNLIFFICLVVVAACVGILIALTTIKGGQDITMGDQDTRLKKMSETLNNFDDLEELLTIQSQLSDLATLNSQKTTLSRIFNILDTLMPTNGDTITISELNVNMDESKISFDAQLRANSEPRINFNALNAFKHSMSMMRYDYGRYVDENGNEIPTLCISEKVIGNGQVKAIWAKGATGCDPSNNEDGATASAKEAQAIFNEAAAEPDLEEKIVTEFVAKNETDEKSEEDEDEDTEKETEDDEDEGGYVAVDEIRWTTIYRTPQFNNWYEKGWMDLSGEISGVQHFESVCITYSGVEESDDDGKSSVKWSSDNTCNLVPNEISVSDAVDGRNTDGEMVLRFSTTIQFDSAVFSFDNKHMLTIGPSGKTDVTDSYLQIENMFEERSDGWKEVE